MMRSVLESWESVVDAKSDYIDCIVYCIWKWYCWWKFWGFWIWNESILALPASPLLCLSSPLAKTSEDNCWWNFWRNATKCEFWLMVRNRTLTAMKYLVRGWTRMKIWRSGVDGTGDLMMNLFWFWFWWLSKVWWCVMIWWSRWCGREMRWGLFK